MVNLNPAQHEHSNFPTTLCLIWINNLIPGPPELAHFADNEYEVLTKYLSLPSTPAELLGSSPQLTALAKKWSNHPNVHIMLKTDPARVTGYPLKLNGLVTLPYDYSELINSVSGFTCPKSQSDDSRVPVRFCFQFFVILILQIISQIPNFLYYFSKKSSYLTVAKGSYML